MKKRAIMNTNINIVVMCLPKCLKCINSGHILTYIILIYNQEINNFNIQGTKERILPRFLMEWNSVPLNSFSNQKSNTCIKKKTFLIIRRMFVEYLAEYGISRVAVLGMSVGSTFGRI